MTSSTIESSHSDKAVSGRWQSKFLSECSSCGKLFHKRHSKQASCSRKCGAKQALLARRSYTGEQNPRWKGGELRMVCEYCGGFYLIPASSIRKGRFCSLICANKWQSDNPRIVSSTKVEKKGKVCGVAFLVKKVKRG